MHFLFGCRACCARYAIEQNVLPPLRPATMHLNLAEFDQIWFSAQVSQLHKNKSCGSTSLRHVRNILVCCDEHMAVAL